MILKFICDRSKIIPKLRYPRQMVVVLLFFNKFLWLKNTLHMNDVSLTASYFSYFYRLGVIIYFPDVLLN
ncbi:MAG: hypothetical protein AMS26_10880 [Bacteroides sp. SM23_62]|nr:MAG: hypothetical protein AMS26_10880 [Bacteroides sp. SM23_62]